VTWCDDFDWPKTADFTALQQQFRALIANSRAGAPKAGPAREAQLPSILARCLLGVELQLERDSEAHRRLELLRQHAPHARSVAHMVAVALAAALKADECQIYTDVDGVYTTDPRIVPEARRLDTITFEEMLEMASLGSKVLQIRSVEFAGKYKVKLRVLSSFDEKDGPGTLITYEEDDKMEKAAISGIAFNHDEAKITVMGVPDRPGIAYQILGPIGEANIDVDMIIQNASVDNMTDFSFTVNRSEYAKAMEVLNKQVKNHIKATDIRGDAKVCKVSLVGVGMRTHAGVAGKMFRTLAEEGINIQMISTSEIKIAVVIDEKYMELAVRALHKAFDLDQPR